jgi:very-short-patch-repair endonuclease
LEQRGWIILRFTNEEVQKNVDGVIATIINITQSKLPAHPQPLPQAGGECHVTFKENS